MMCYKDMTFCREDTCKHFNNGCERSYTKDVDAAAKRWWKNDNPPVCFYTEQPNCYEQN